MSKPWHGEIAGLISPLPDKRQHTGEIRGSGGGGGGERGWRGGDVEVEGETEQEERYKMGGRGKRWWEVERWQLWSCNKKGGRGEAAYSTFRAEGKGEGN